MSTLLSTYSKRECAEILGVTAGLADTLLRYYQTSALPAEHIGAVMLAVMTLVGENIGVCGCSECAGEMDEMANDIVALLTPPEVPVQ